MSILTRLTTFTHECRVKLWIAAHISEAEAIAKALATPVSSSIEAGGVGATILSIASTIHADLQNPAYEQVFTDAKAVAKAIASGGASLATVEAIYPAVMNAVGLIEEVKAASAKANPSASAAPSQSPAPAASSPATAAPPSAAPNSGADAAPAAAAPAQQAPGTGT